MIDLDPSTIVVHGGRPAPAAGAPVNPPVELSATYRAGGDPIYGRDGNATWSAFEEVVGSLEGGTAVVFASGLAAVSAVLETMPAGGWIVGPGDAYNGTRRLLADSPDRRRLATREVDLSDTYATLDVCSEVAASSAGAGLLWIESPSNPLLAIADLPALVAGAHSLGLRVGVDNTFATPLLQNPLALGADVVVHSATKLLSGHSDVVLGVAVSGDDGIVEALRNRRSLHGAIPGPMEVFLALRGVRTLAVRLERAQATASTLALRLVDRPGITGVRYPGLPNHAGYERAVAQMRGFGTMLSFEVAAGAAAAEKVCESVRVMTPATSLGGVETLIERRARWQGESHLPAGLLRLSVGLEHVEDLWRDLDQALGAAGVGQ